MTVLEHVVAVGPALTVWLHTILRDILQVMVNTVH